jgi:diaminopimelate decarboxylase
MKQTPHYFYDLDLLDDTLTCIKEEVKKVNFHVHYAIKANHNEVLLKHISKNGFGADCVSSGEIEYALNAGFSSDEIVFAGVGKTDAEIIYALEQNVGMLHCESLEEVVVINEIATRMNQVATIALRLNPNVNPLTHEKISTGLKENKFGLTSFEFNELVKLKGSLPNVNIVGMHFHIGSQISDLSVFVDLCVRINEFAPLFESEIGPLTYLNVGGGLGIDYFEPDENPIPEFEAYFEVFKTCLSINKSIPVHFELGRSIVAQCGSLRTEVLYVKKSETKNFAVLDAGMTELLRPAMYDAYHKIEKLNHSVTSEDLEYDIVGPICESSDCFGKDILLPILKRGDVLTIRSCGAYAESMSLRYNGRKQIESYVHSTRELMRVDL